MDDSDDSDDDELCALIALPSQGFPAAAPGVRNTAFYA
jgi:hypothetical protein